MKILIVDNDIELRAWLEFILTQAGYLVLTAATGAEALAKYSEEQPDLLILEVNLPGVSGLEICQQIRCMAETRILVLTTRTSEEDQVRALDMGADAFLTKPYSPRTLLARIRALLRRPDHGRLQPRTAGTIVLDAEAQAAQIKGSTSIPLTNLEYRLLQYLLINEGRIIPAERLTTQVWGHRGKDDRHMLKQLVHRLRQKIEDRPAEPQHLLTVSGIGYRFLDGLT